jgi:hypothetical protein
MAAPTHTSTILTSLFTLFRERVSSIIGGTTLRQLRVRSQGGDDDRAKIGLFVHRRDFRRAP